MGGNCCKKKKQQEEELPSDLEGPAEIQDPHIKVEEQDRMPPPQKQRSRNIREHDISANDRTTDGTLNDATMHTQTNLKESTKKSQVQNKAKLNQILSEIQSIESTYQKSSQETESKNFKKQRPPPLDKSKSTRNQFTSQKYLPINIRKEYARQFQNLPQISQDTSDVVKELFMTLNLARQNPVFFSNNVLEVIRDRMHYDTRYHSFSQGVIPSQEGIECVDSLISDVCKCKPMRGLQWNQKLASIIDLSEVARIDCVMTPAEQAQMGEEDYLKSLLRENHSFYYEHLYVYFELNTTYGFEIATNLLLDDGNEFKDTRAVLLMQKLSTIAIFHVKHVTGPMFTYIVCTSDEITHEEYNESELRKSKSQIDQSRHSEPPIDDAVSKRSLVQEPNFEDKDQESQQAIQLSLFQPQKVASKTPIAVNSKLQKGSLEGIGIKRLGSVVRESNKESERKGLTNRLAPYDMNSSYPQSQLQKPAQGATQPMHIEEAQPQLEIMDDAISQDKNMLDDNNSVGPLEQQNIVQENPPVQDFQPYEVKKIVQPVFQNHDQSYHKSDNISFKTVNFEDERPYQNHAPLEADNSAVELKSSKRGKQYKPLPIINQSTGSDFLVKGTSRNNVHKRALTEDEKKDIDRQVEEMLNVGRLQLGNIRGGKQRTYNGY